MKPKCERCRKESLVSIMSMFNTQMICMDCKDKEEKHPMYKRARNIEADMVKMGQYNFEGIGLPINLK